jgi:hypothetical protein
VFFVYFAHVWPVDAKLPGAHQLFSRKKAAPTINLKLFVPLRVCVGSLQFASQVELHAPAEEDNPANIGLLNKGKGNEVKGKG